MKHTLLIIWTKLKPDLIYSDDREYLETLIKDLASLDPKNKYYIFENTGPISRRIVECESGEITYL